MFSVVKSVMCTSTVLFFEVDYFITLSFFYDKIKLAPKLCLFLKIFKIIPAHFGLCLKMLYYLKPFLTWMFLWTNYLFFFKGTWKGASSFWWRRDVLHETTGRFKWTRWWSCFHGILWRTATSCLSSWNEYTNTKLLQKGLFSINLEDCI